MKSAVEVNSLIEKHKFDAENQNTVLMALEGCSLAPKEKVRCLQKWRKDLLENIHSEQKMLDKVDFCIYKLNK